MPNRPLAVLLLALAAPAVVPTDLAAASADRPRREPVLKQIKVPHRYYYREMYLPQLTSGPTAPTWSPEGREIAFSMQGSLWRMEVGSGLARQITDGPGYHHQPDWSPEGRFLVFAAYEKDAVELRGLDLVTGEEWSLTTGGAVNVEPRVSPDGRRLAYVSTAHEGRFHLFVLPLQGGRAAGAAIRISEDRDSGLPRYYYSVYDHYLSPSWSPDSGELMYVSNHGRVWGAGGIWRARAEPGAAETEIRREETSWKARPDWSRDGRRIVYSSYLGRQWNQLWLTSTEGEEPFPLTYGEWDATSPRFSPDGRRIVYVSNETGNTALWIIEVPGGRRQGLEIRERRYLKPPGALSLVVRGPEGGEMPARVSVTGEDGRAYAPDDALVHADDHFVRAERPFEYAYFHTRGRSELRVPAGRVTVEATRGPEYAPWRRTVEVEAGSPVVVEASLPRIDDLAARGWRGADMHVHMNYGGHYRMVPETLRRQAEAEDLALVFNLIVNKEQRVPDIAYFTGRPDPASTVDNVILHSQEFHTSLWGHLGLLGLRSHVLLPLYAAYAKTAAASPFPDNTAITDLARAQGAISGYVHPFDALPQPEKKAVLTLLSAAGFGAGDPLGLPVDAALGRLDYYEVVGFADPRTSAEVWYRLLNCGFRIPAGAGTDAMANYASLRGPVGLNRAYARMEGPPDEARFLAAVKAGRTFATNGPLLEFTLAGQEPGIEIARPRGRHRLEAKVRLRSFVPVDHLEIVGNGKVVAEVPLSAPRTSAEATLPLTVSRSGWYTLRAWSETPQHPVLDGYPFATTSPIYVAVDGAPVRSLPDARYFLAWVDRVLEAVTAHPDWNTPAEKDEVLARLARARAEFEERARALRDDLQK
jgi:Tol biopolymer transport system component